MSATEETPNMDEIVRHAEEYAQERNKSFSEAAVEMAEHLNGVEARDIIEAQ